MLYNRNNEAGDKGALPALSKALQSPCGKSAPIQGTPLSVATDAKTDANPPLP